MNLQTLFGLVALSLPLASAACSSAADGSDAAASNDELTAVAAADIEGAWSIDPATNGSGGLDLRPTGQFFWDDASRRSEGSYTVDKRAHTLTTKVDGNETVYRYVYKPALILNGMPLAGGGAFPAAHLELQQLRPMTMIAVSFEFVQVDSWCASAADCMLEQQDDTWAPDSASEGAPACRANRCEMGDTRSAGERAR